MSYDYLIYAILLLLFVMFIRQSGRTYPIITLFLFTYFVQYVVAPYLLYSQYKQHTYLMAVNDKTYFAYIIPAIIALFSGIYLISKKVNFSAVIYRINPDEAWRLGIFLVVFSYGFDFLVAANFEFLNPLISFTQYLKYTGAFCLLFAQRKLAYVLIGIIYLNLLGIVLATGVFVDFFIWTAYLIFFIFLRFKLGFVSRLLVFLALLPIMFFVQGVKAEYREVIWKQDEAVGNIGLLLELIEAKEHKTKNQPFFESDSFVRTIYRLNQGWHVSMTLRHVPRKQPFVYGHEMLGDIGASLLPRFLYPEKREVNSREKFRKYTGYPINQSTSMSIGMVGDFYINFGYWGSILMLFVFGALVAVMLNFFLRKYVALNPIDIIWIPFLFSYLIRANNDFYIFFNCLVKSFVLFLLIVWVRTHFVTKPKRFAA